MRLRIFRSEESIGRRLTCLAFCLVAGAASLGAQPCLADPAISADGIWCEVSASMPRTAYLYLTLSIVGDVGERLVSAASPVAARIDLLSNASEHRPRTLVLAPSLPLDPHEPTILEPNGPHLILRGLTRKLVVGEEIPVTLNFAHAGVQGISAKVLSRAPIAGLPVVPKGVKLD